MAPMSRPSTPALLLLLLDAGCAAVLVSWVGGCSGHSVLDQADGAALLQVSSRPTMVDSDDVPVMGVVLSAADGRETRLPDARAAALWPGAAASLDTRLVVVDADARLLVQQGASRRQLLDGVVGEPVVLDNQRVIVARQTEPGESDLWVVTDDGQPPRALAAAPGADDSAMVLHDGRVLFVSGRSGVASLWIVDADPMATPRQLTNVGQRPGALTSLFVPPPATRPTQQGSIIVSDDGEGGHWLVDLDSGAVARQPVVVKAVR
jgi:hypothetical protein